MIVCRGLDPNDSINSISEWFGKCPPQKREEHWKDGRSVKELAKYWLTNQASSIQLYTDVINSHHDFQNITLDLGSPEYVTDFDDYGNGRAHDFFISGQQDSEKLLVGVEDKVDANLIILLANIIWEVNLKRLMIIILMHLQGLRI